MKPITATTSSDVCASGDDLGVRVALALIRAYKVVVSPHFRGACRFLPSCADYAADAVALHGIWRGGWLAARRLARCNPLGTPGHDPVPAISDPCGR